MSFLALGGMSFQALGGISQRARMAYRDAVRSVTPTERPQRRLPAWAVAEGPFGIGLFDAGIVALVIAANEINVITGSGPGAVPLDLRAYLFGALLAMPILFRHRWPFQVMLACAALIFLSRWARWSAAAGPWRPRLPPGSGWPRRNARPRRAG
jgi:hypothetical protein